MDFAQVFLVGCAVGVIVLALVVLIRRYATDYYNPGLGIILVLVFLFLGWLGGLIPAREWVAPVEVSLPHIGLYTLAYLMVLLGLAMWISLTRPKWLEIPPYQKATPRH